MIGVIGSTMLGNFDWTHGCVENGFTWLERGSWGQGFNEETKLLLLDCLFGDLGFARVEWQCDSMNTRSAAALARLGFPLEGTLRSRHIRPDGTRRDSLVFGLVADDWPAVRPGITALFERAGRSGAARGVTLRPSGAPTSARAILHHTELDPLADGPGIALDRRKLGVHFRRFETGHRRL